MNADEVYLRHILDAIEKIEGYTSVGKDVFMEQSHWQDATIRQLEIVGEATKNISMAFRGQYPDTPWKRIAGLRDVLIHHYMGVDLSAVWEISQRDIPVLKQQLKAILEGE
jgi:uncharacterized protein with HEPN domain